MELLNNYWVAMGLAFVVAVAAYPMFIPFLHKLKFGQTVSEYMPSQAKKNGTPTMGGVIFVLVPTLLIGIFYRQIFTDPKAALVLLAFVGYGIIGFIDDYIIVVQHNNAGLSPKMKLILQILLSVVFYMIYSSHVSTEVNLFGFVIDFKFLYVFLVVLLFTSASNAVNLTDGMDGLASGTVIISYIPFLLFALSENEMNTVLIIMLIIGGLLGFLVFNHHPAKIFMGDAGSLALGGVLAALGLVLKRELLVIVIGLVFVCETLSVIIQVTSVKTRGKRVFKCTPIHYHFEQSGMSEVQVVLMFYAIGAVCATIGYFLGR